MISVLRDVTEDSQMHSAFRDVADDTQVSNVLRDVPIFRSDKKYK